MNYLKNGQFFGQTNKTIRLGGLTITDTEYTEEKVDWHHHENPYFTFIVQGNILEGNKKETYHCSGGTLLFHNWHESHYNIKPAGFTRGFQIEMNADWLKSYDLDLKALTGSQNIFDPQIRILFHNIFKESLINDDLSSLSIEGYLLVILERLSELQSLADTCKPAWVRKIDEIFRNDISEGLNLKSVATKLDLHPIYLSRAFPKFFDCGFSDYIRKLRVGKALSMLRVKDTSLTEIASTSGFADQSHFIRCFRSHTGVSPSHFRKLIVY